jgi:hypothetical protein
MTRKNAQKTAARDRQERLGGKYLHHRAVDGASATLAWYWRREIVGAGWTIAACSEHGERLEREFRFARAQADHVVDGRRLNAPSTCPLCAGTLTFDEVAACRCEVTLGCPVHPNEQLVELDARVSMMRGRSYGDYPWDHWAARARADGVREDLVTLGRSLMREFFQHAWSTELGPFCGYGDMADERMIAFAKSAPEAADKRWTWLLETDGLRGEWRDGGWHEWGDAEVLRALARLGEP